MGRFGLTTRRELRALENRTAQISEQIFGRLSVAKKLRRGNRGCVESPCKSLSALCAFGSDSMREDLRDFVIANFMALEEQLLQCMEFIPYVQQNRNVVSPKFIPILIEVDSEPNQR